ncbi:MAG: hypothetical protein E7I90_01825 [Clostridium sp.]|nr:hypothetical protein [Clostridium sp.]
MRKIGDKYFPIVAGATCRCVMFGFGLRIFIHRCGSVVAPLLTQAVNTKAKSNTNYSTKMFRFDFIMYITFLINLNVFSDNHRYTGLSVHHQLH